jgi:hypothetical protein
VVRLCALLVGIFELAQMSFSRVYGCKSCLVDCTISASMVCMGLWYKPEYSFRTASRR